MGTKPTTPQCSSSGDELPPHSLIACDDSFRALAEAMPIGIFRSDASGACIYVNRRCAEMIGLEPGEAVGWGWVQNLHADDRIRISAEGNRSREQRMPFSAEYRFVGAAGGEMVWVLGQFLPLQDASGSHLGHIGTVTDITSNKLTEQLLRDSEMRLRLMGSQIPAVLWTTDCNLRFTSGMGAGLNDLGVEPGQGSSLSLMEFFSQAGGEMPVAIEAHREALTGQARSYEQFWAGHWYQSHVEPLRGPDGLITGVIGVALDITARKAAEDEVRQTRDELEQRVQRRTTELTAANQALLQQIEQRKTIEQSLLQSQEMLRASEKRAREAAESNSRLVQELDHRVRNNLAGLLSLVDAMRSYTRDVGAFAGAIEGRLLAMSHVHQMLAATQWHGVDLRQMIASLLSAVEKLSCFTIPVAMEGPPVHVFARQAMPLSMVLLEWFTNSCKHGAHSTETGRLSISWTYDAAAHRVRLRWHETGGPGIDKALMPSLGTSLVEGLSSRELRGRCELRYPPTGADHLLEFEIQ